MADAGEPQRALEPGWEITYSDQLTPWLTVQPDVQFIHDAAVAAGNGDALVFALRLTFTPPTSD